MGQTGVIKKPILCFGLPHPPMGQTGGHKIANLVLLPLISFIFAFTALECIKRYWETLCEESR